MEVTKQWLESKIAKLNDWLDRASSKHFKYRLKCQNRDYYVRKLIELEEQSLDTIKI